LRNWDTPIRDFIRAESRQRQNHESVFIKILTYDFSLIMARYWPCQYWLLSQELSELSSSQEFAKGGALCRSLW